MVKYLVAISENGSFKFKSISCVWAIVLGFDKLNGIKFDLLKGLNKYFYNLQTSLPNDWQKIYPWLPIDEVNINGICYFLKYQKFDIETCFGRTTNIPDAEAVKIYEIVSASIDNSNVKFYYTRNQKYGLLKDMQCSYHEHLRALLLTIFESKQFKEGDEITLLFTRRRNESDCNNLVVEDDEAYLLFLNMLREECQRVSSVKIKFDILLQDRALEFETALAHYFLIANKSIKNSFKIDICINEVLAKYDSCYHTDMATFNSALQNGGPIEDLLLLDEIIRENPMINLVEILPSALSINEATMKILDNFWLIRFGIEYNLIKNNPSEKNSFIGFCNQWLNFWAKPKVGQVAPSKTIQEANRYLDMLNTKDAGKKFVEESNQKILIRFVQLIFAFSLVDLPVALESKLRIFQKYFKAANFREAYLALVEEDKLYAQTGDKLILASNQDIIDIKYYGSREHSLALSIRLGDMPPEEWVESETYLTSLAKGNREWLQGQSHLFFLYLLINDLENRIKDFSLLANQEFEPFEFTVGGSTLYPNGLTLDVYQYLIQLRLIAYGVRSKWLILDRKNILNIISQIDAICMSKIAYPHFILLKWLIYIANVNDIEMKNTWVTKILDDIEILKNNDLDCLLKLPLYGLLNQKTVFQEKTKEVIKILSKGHFRWVIHNNTSLLNSIVNNEPYDLYQLMVMPPYYYG